VVIFIAAEATLGLTDLFPLFIYRHERLTYAVAS
jgi:hypothetical protein